MVIRSVLTVLKHELLNNLITCEQGARLISSFPYQISSSRVECFIIVFPRIDSLENIHLCRDALLHDLGDDSAQEQLIEAGRRMGWLNIVNPEHPLGLNGIYNLNLSIRDEREFAKVLLIVGFAEAGNLASVVYSDGQSKLNTPGMFPSSISNHRGTWY
jgi:hypothetical protein